VYNQEVEVTGHSP